MMIPSPLKTHTGTDNLSTCDENSIICVPNVRVDSSVALTGPHRPQG